MASAPQSIYGIEFSKDGFQWVQYLPQDNAISTVAVVPVTPDPEAGLEKVQAAFKERALKADFKKNKCDCVCSLPSETALVKKLIIDRNETDIKSAIEWELSQQIIGTIDDYIFDYEVLPGYPDSSVQQFLVVGYRPEPVKNILNLLKSLKARVLSIDIDMFALQNLLDTSYIEQNNNYSFIIHGNDVCTKVLLSYRGNFIDYETFSYDLDSMDSETYNNQLKTSVDRLRTIYQLENQVIPQFISGQLFFEEEFRKDFIESHEHTEMLNPFKTITCLQENACVPEYFLRLTVATGLAIRGATEA